MDWRKGFRTLCGVVNSDLLVSVIILNYNGARWLERCLNSLRGQTILARTEIIVADNLSTDGSDQLATRLTEGWPNARVVQHGKNLGYCSGNNVAAALARGRYLFFLNNDTWLENECLEILIREVENAGASAGCPLVLNYEDQSFQSMGALGFDLFGLPTARMPTCRTGVVLMPEGCAYLIERALFEKLGGFDPEFFMFSDELDLSWRVWITGGQAVAVPASKLHHRGAAQVNPQGGGQLIEFRTSDTKRFYANRNGLLVLLKNAKNVLLLAVLLQLALLACEAVVSLVLVRRWSFVKRAYWGALKDCWHLRSHVVAERRRLRPLRCRSDWWMLRFFRWRLNRWDELARAWRLGLPKITAQ
jgi:GT2 family glycosyltransferase